jgi:hypothetical protein
MATTSDGISTVVAVRVSFENERWASTQTDPEANAHGSVGENRETGAPRLNSPGI